VFDVLFDASPLIEPVETRGGSSHVPVWFALNVYPVILDALFCSKQWHASSSFLKIQQWRPFSLMLNVDQACSRFDASLVRAVHPTNLFPHQPNLAHHICCCSLLLLLLLAPLVVGHPLSRMTTTSPTTQLRGPRF
jgi:hypothetical protein